jgi:hypothetical protein
LFRGSLAKIHLDLDRQLLALKCLDEIVEILASHLHPDLVDALIQAETLNAEIVGAEPLSDLHFATIYAIAYHNAEVLVSFAQTYPALGDEHSDQCWKAIAERFRYHPSISGRIETRHHMFRKQGASVAITDSPESVSEVEISRILEDLLHADGIEAVKRDYSGEAEGPALWPGLMILDRALRYWQNRNEHQFVTALEQARSLLVCVREQGNGDRSYGGSAQKA